MDAQDVFPALAGFPDAVDDATRAAGDVTILRLASRARNLDALRRLSRLERLWCFNLDSKSAPIVGSLATLRRLYVDGMRLVSLDAFAYLTELEVLSLEGCTRVASLDELAPFRGVRALGITHFPKVRSLEPLAEFLALKALVVAGAMWTRMTVDSLRPLAALTGLRFLHLTNLKPRDESLEPLAALSGLTTLDLPNFYPVEEFALLSARLPNTQCTWFQPVVPVQYLACPKCNQPAMVMLTGKGKPTLCTACDAGRIKAHDDYFRAVAAKAA